MKNNRGVIFVSVLLIIVVVAMFIGAFLMRSQGTLFGAASYRDGVRAEQAARAGVNHLLAILESDNSFAQDFEVKLGRASYSVTFDPDSPHFSVNNLTSPSEATQLSCQGYKVASKTADLVVVGRCGTSRRALRAVAQHGLSAGRSVAAVGRIELSGDVVVDGVTSLGSNIDLSKSPPVLDPESQSAGGLLSKHQAEAGGPAAIEWTSGTSFALGELSRLETAPPNTGGTGVSSNLVSLHPDKVIEQGAATNIPDIDVNAYVQAGLASPALPGGGTLSGYVSVLDERSVAGNLVVNGDLRLANGTLYVDGDLTVNGGVSGLGAIYVSGNVTVQGGDALIQTGQPSGAALFAGGDITLTGLDGLGYLDALAAGDPAFQTAVTRLKGGLEAYATASTASLWGHTVLMAKHYDAYDHPNSQTPWVSPIPGPNGTFNSGRSNGIVPAVLIHLRSIPGYALDPRALKVIRALEQVQYHFRHNRHNVRADLRTLAAGGPGASTSIMGGGQQIIITEEYGVTVTDAGGNQVPVLVSDFDDHTTYRFVLGEPHWDDESYPDPTDWTHDRILNIPSGHPASGIKDELHNARRNAFIEHNPVDLSWLGRSAFQGIVYARGDVRAETSFSVVGAVISLGDVHLGNGSTMIFNQEYLSLFGARLPLGLVHIEEI